MNDTLGRGGAHGAQTIIWARKNTDLKQVSPESEKPDQDQIEAPSELLERRPERANRPARSRPDFACGQGVQVRDARFLQRARQ